MTPARPKDISEVSGRGSDAVSGGGGRRGGGGTGGIHAELIGSEVFNPTTDSKVDKNPKGRARRRITLSCCDNPGIIQDLCRGQAQSEDTTSV